MPHASPPVVTVTLNPAMDQFLWVDALQPGAVHRVQRSHHQAGGKGLNVATLLALGGQPVTVSGFLGADNASIFEDHMAAHSLTDAFIRIPGATRVSLKILDAHSGTTDLNGSGLAPDSDALARLRERLLNLAQEGAWFVFGGSLPPGMEVTDFTDLLRDLKTAGCRLAVDSSGAALRAAVDVGVELIKPNAQELAELLDLPDTEPDRLMAAVDALVQEKSLSVILSMGEQGAYFVADGQQRLARVPAPLEVVSTVGAGDALLAGYLAGRLQALPLSDCARWATAYAWSRLSSVEPRLEQLSERCAAVAVH